MSTSPLDTMREHGFVPLPGFLDPDRLARLRRAADQLREHAAGLSTSTDDFVLEAAGAGGWVAWQQGDPPVPGLLRSVSRAHTHTPDVAAVQDELDLPATLVPRLVGAPGTLATSFLWAKPPQLGSEKPWHQDLAFAPPGFDTATHSVVTVWVAVDPATEDNGCLQFVPGSHRHGLLPHHGDLERGPDQPPLAGAVEPHADPDRLFPGVPAVSVPLAPGSAVAFDGRVLHRSAPNTTTAQPRTAISYVYKVPAPAWT